VNRLGRIARLHHQPEACVQIINTQYGFNAMEVQEAFVKASCRTAAVLLLLLLLLVLLLYLPTCCTP
jgi:transformation/transcription domain-associated protein